ncbi:tripartite tricarboxylate transporter TctB family protein [Saccharopolyspora indica]|uniref:tripartite tricarboxylate transporter TctB family protein n=1 Tax=Saccharopolyspora indica TaxID=1229659 RepID=UPI0022EA8871|nr:tripartite tricarboxylate transporter TctB family protein [Saccharopolyspora indica]MDA3647443.1 tripartite tricarboxylate transporter TctB family protein [Saccharopolyspora indica]
MSGAEPERPAGFAANVVVALVVVAVGICGAVGSWSLGLGSAAEPAAGTWPFLVSVVIAVLGVVLGLLARRTSDAERMSSANWAVLAGIASMAGFAAAITAIGFEIPAALLAFGWLRFLGRESWRVSVLGGLGVVVAFYAVFVGLLKVPVPHLF